MASYHKNHALQPLQISIKPLLPQSCTAISGDLSLMACEIDIDRRQNTILPYITAHNMIFYNILSTLYMYVKRVIRYRV